MSRKTLDNFTKANVVIGVDPLECPFREFRDNELQTDAWGLGSAAFRAHNLYVKMAVKPTYDGSGQTWVDDQTQPLPRSVRQYLHGWIRAEELASDRWDAEVAIYEDDPNGGKMCIADIQLSHAQVLLRSSFCRRVLSACFMLERVEGYCVEHQWENFVCSFTPEGWRAKYHIYSPGLKPGGGIQHKPGLSKNGCYLVRLFYLGAWRCVWVSDQVPVDATESPLLPFSPLLTHPPAIKPKQAPATVTASEVYLWPLLLCKALLKLAAPDMNSDEDSESVEDEALTEFNILHALTGSMDMRYNVPDAVGLWNLITSEVPVFAWDDDDETQPSTIKSRSTKKPTTREAATIRRLSMMYLVIKDTKNLPSYYLPGITPGHEMCLLVTMARDLPLKKPLPEPEVALWKYYRWVDWARRHGLYEAYDCPRTKYLKCNGLMKLSHAPHLLDVQSTESITYGFIEEHVKSNGVAGDEPKKKDKKPKEQTRSAIAAANLAQQQLKEEMREWVHFESVHSIVKDVDVIYYPSMFQFTSGGSNPPLRITKSATQRLNDITAPKAAPLYLQIDGPEANKLRMSLSTMHPRVLLNTGCAIMDFIEPAYVVLEKFEWFVDTAVPIPKAYVMTRGYETVEVDFQPGRHFCRLWTHSRLHWHVMLMSDSTLLLGSRDVIQGAAIRDCPWASKFLLALGAAFTNWSKVNRSNPNILLYADREFFKSYLPDLTWDDKVVGYHRTLIHWMFRQALQSHLSKRLNYTEMKATCYVLRKYFCDPDFGFPSKPLPPRPVREIANMDVCDCIMPELEEVEMAEEQLGEAEQAVEEKPLVEPEVMEKLLTAPKPPIASQVCELATEDLPCGILKDEREKMILKHEAATVLQAHWRGTWARKCLKSRATFTPEVTKYVQEHAFGNLDALSGLMNEFFAMFPGTKCAFSVASALSGSYGIIQHSGVSPVTSKCKWIPYFQGVFYCHARVKVHFDVISSVAHSTLAVYDNDSGAKLPQAYNTHITFDFQPNCLGYTVIGHGTVNQATGTNFDAHWQLTVMSCIVGAFHICDNDDPCKDLPLAHASKLHIDEIFLPNRRNIVGGIQISVTKHEAVSFRACATSPDLEMVATLRSIAPDGYTEELSKCTGKGEIHWPYIRLEPYPPPAKARSMSHANLGGREYALTSARSLNRAKTKPAISSKNRSVTKLQKPAHDPKMYSIEVVCPMGWPLTLAQWKRVDEVRNSHEFSRAETNAKKAAFGKTDKPVITIQKPGSAKDKEKEKLPVTFAVLQPQPGDAFVELECSLAIGGGATAKRDDDRDIEFATARRAWDAKEHGRNHRGAQIRKEFRTEFLVVPPPVKPASESFVSAADEMTPFDETEGEDEKIRHELNPIQRPSPATESGLLEMTMESEEEALYLTMPEHLRDKFVPLFFLPFCMKEKMEDESVLVTPDMAEAAMNERQARIEATQERMRELQAYNEEKVLGRQKTRCQLLDKLFVDGQWCQELQDVLEERDDAIAREILIRTLSASKKKFEAKKK